MLYGYCLPGGSFMPQGVAEVKSASQILFDGYRVVADAGFDYGECTVGLLNKLTEAELDRVAELVGGGKMKIRACNSLIPGSMKLCGDKADLAASAEYVGTVMAKMDKINSRILVLGSGSARSVPDGFDFSRGRAQIMDFLRVCGGLGEKYGVTMVLEPLNRRESNIMQTSAECLEMVRELSLPKIKLLIDSFHFSEENEPFTAISNAANELIHVHIAEPVCRKRPGYTDEKFKDGGAYVGRFITKLENVGYNGGVTVECGMTDFVTDVRETMKYLK